MSSGTLLPAPQTLLPEGNGETSDDTTVHNAQERPGVRKLKTVTATLVDGLYQ